MSMPLPVTAPGVNRLRRARASTWLAFCAMGVVTSTWAARIPAVQDRLDLSPGEFAVAVLGLEAGALVGLPLGAVLVSRWSDRRSTQAGFAVYAAGLPAAALAPALSWLTVVLGLWAMANSVLDVALNARGVELGRRYGRPVLSGLHAAQSIGLLLGAATAAAAAALGVDSGVHFGAIAAVALLVALPATLAPSGATEPEPPGRSLTRPDRRLLVVGSLAFCAFLVDGTVNNWIAVHLRTEHGAGQGLAAAGYLVFTGALIIGRLPGDRLVTRLSRRRVPEACGLLTAGGPPLGLRGPGPPPPLAGGGA